jgi:hypothetical protein
MKIPKSIYPPLCQRWLPILPERHVRRQERPCSVA